jgi:hypothetical protein
MATIGSYLFIVFPFIEIYYVLPLLTPNIPLWLDFVVPID